MNFVIDIGNLDKAKKQLQMIQVSSQGIEIMAPKMLHLNVKLLNVKLGAANILKQEMLSIGAEAAISRDVIIGKALLSDLILSGTIDKFQKLIKKLDYQTIFGLPDIKKSLIELIRISSTSESDRIAMNNTFLDLSPVKIMGILNCTPDSFSDGNKYLDTDKAFQHAMQMIEDGADFIDLGGESSRPGIEPISAQEEIARILPVLKLLKAKTTVPISIDTYHAETVRIALLEGAEIINEISALNFDKDMIKVLGQFKQAPIILMHMLGEPRTMQQNPTYVNVLEDILKYFEERISFCEEHNIDKSRLILDPGIGFGKRFEDNLLILNNLESFKSFGLPVLLGTSRKSFINQIYESKPEERLCGTLATTALAFEKNINIVRVHDVKENKQFIETLKKVRTAI